MDRERILLKLVLDEIGLGDLKLDSFSDRLRIQKKIYLTQIAGLDMGYRYNWYIRGPYCPSLTQNAFLLKDEITDKEREDEEYTLTETAKNYIGKANEIWSLPLDVEATEPDWIELLASLHYLANIAYWPNKVVTQKKVATELKKAKPHFNGKDTLIAKAWERLETLGFIDPEP